MAIFNTKTLRQIAKGVNQNPVAGPGREDYSRLHAMERSPNGAVALAMIARAEASVSDFPDLIHLVELSEHAAGIAAVKYADQVWGLTSYGVRASKAAGVPWDVEPMIAKALGLEGKHISKAMGAILKWPTDLRQAESIMDRVLRAIPSETTAVLWREARRVAMFGASLDMQPPTFPTKDMMEGILEIMHDAHAARDLPASDGLTALEHAFKQRDYSIARLLVENGAKGTDAMFWTTARRGNGFQLHAFAFLEDLGFTLEDPHTLDNDGNDILTATSLAVLDLDELPRMVELLKACGADPEFGDASGTTLADSARNFATTGDIAHLPLVLAGKAKQMGNIDRAKAVIAEVAIVLSTQRSLTP
jgi:hypothetical protein